MRLKLNIKNLTFEGEVEFSRADLLEAPTPIEPNHSPGPVAIPAAPEASQLCCKPEASPGRPKRAPKPRAEREPTEEAGPLKVDTGRRSSQETLEILRAHQPCGPKQIADVLGISAAAASQRLSSLMAKGFVQFVSRGQYRVIEGAD